MDIKVLYHSTTGNTKKVAEAIAAEAGVIAQPLTEASGSTSTDILFIGDGVYGAKVHKSTVSFIKKLSPASVKNAAVFSTFGGQDTAPEIIKGLLKAQGIPVAEESFSCKGKAWFFLNRKQPSAQELDAAKLFAKNIIKKCTPV